MRAWLHGLVHRLRALVRRDRWEQGLEDELRFHLEMETRKLISQGLPPSEARRLAGVRMGGEERMKERARLERGTVFVDRIRQDVAYGLRTLSRTPGFTVVATVTLALGIGANTALFSMVDGTLLRPLPYPDPAALFFLEERTSEGQTHPGSIENFRDFRRAAGSARALAVAGHPAPRTILGLEEPVRAAVMEVARDYFEVAGVPPARGRALDPSEGRLGGRSEAVVSHAFWQRHLAADPDLGRSTLGIDGRQAQVVGVMPPGFALLGDADVWLHLEQVAELPNHRGSLGWRVVGRLADGVSLDEARREMDLIATRIADEFAGETRIAGAALTPLKDEVVGDLRRPLWILLGASTFVLLVACTNLAATMLARGTARQGEMDVRAALGAGRGRLLRQLFTESLLLSVGGVALGLGMAWGLLRSVELLAPDALPTSGTIGLDVRVAAYSTIVAVGAAVLFGLLPALRLLGPGPRSLGVAHRRVAAGSDRGPWGLLVAGEVALALVLVVGSGLLARTLWSIVTTDPGFRTDGVVAADIDLPRALYPGPLDGAAFFRRLMVEVQNTPGVTDAGAVLLLPTFASSMVSGIEKEGEPRDPEGPVANYRTVEGRYFETLEIPLLRGRLFEDSDAAGTPHVAVVNASMANRFWPGEDPLGRRFHLGGMDPYRDDWVTVVGVVGETRRWDRPVGDQPALYLPAAQRPYFGWYFGMTFVARGPLSTADLSAAVRAAVQSTDRQVPVEIALLRDRVSTTWSEQRFNAGLLGGFAVLALLLAGVGIYGVVSYTVERRHRESGIRIALGARPGQVAALIRREALAMAGAGVLVGILGAAILSRALAGLLVGVSPLDGWSFAGGTLALLGVAWAGAAIPAWRSTRADPLAAIRTE